MNADPKDIARRVAGMAGLRQVILHDPSIRQQALALVAGNVNQLWIVAGVAGSLLTDILQTETPGDPTIPALVQDANRYLVGASLSAAGIDSEPFLEGLLKLITAIRKRGEKRA